MNDNPEGTENMATIEKALEIAAQAHAGQKDKEGLPYILHPLRVLNGVEGEEAQIVAVLHDVVEDTTVTLDDLRRAGFSETVLAAVQCVTHGNDEPYAEYVVRCKANAIARQVKLADLHDNARLSRLILRPQRLQPDLARLHRYVLSYKFLTDQLSEEQYRILMKELG
jgi:(p)ppGpp synthase/HD superfamily hydrolase